LKVYHHIDEFTGATNAVVTTGTFDGVHTGHQVIIKRLNEIAAKENGESVLLTFYPHPRMVLFPDDIDLKLLTTQEEKIALLEKYGIQHLIIQPFTKEFSRLSSLQFIREILVNKIKTEKLVIGYDHHFGRNREGSFEHLKESGPLYGFTVEEIPAQDVDHVAVSSTKIRQALLEGDVKTAKEFLGHDYTLTGKVIHGEKKGHELGYPTANISVESRYKLIPAIGIYAVKTEVDGKLYDGMLYIGFRPTLNGTYQSIEVNIFDFDQDIYGQHITVHFISRLRDDMKFDNVEDLKKQLLLDKQMAVNLLSETGK
jgi:riboflavin kinase / FMN adenylyltransferase